jgi:hypothetical protein
MLRATMQTQEHVAYAFLGSKKHLMTRVFTDRNEPLYHSAPHASAQATLTVTAQQTEPAD